MRAETVVLTAALLALLALLMWGCALHTPGFALVVGYGRVSEACRAGEIPVQLTPQTEAMTSAETMPVATCNVTEVGALSWSQVVAAIGSLLVTAGLL